mgnify:CR=1 FL=1
MMHHKGKTVNLDAVAPKPEPFTKPQWFTVACITILIFLVVVPALPGMKQFFPKRCLSWPQTWAPSASSWRAS